MRMKRTGAPSAAKAREILHDGTVRGNPLTSRQRRFMGAAAGGTSTMKQMSRKERKSVFKKVENEPF